MDSAVRQPLIKAAGGEIPMGQLVEGGGSFEPPEAKAVLFMPACLRKQLEFLERLRRQAADYTKRTEALAKGAQGGCFPLSKMAVPDLKRPLGTVSSRYLATRQKNLRDLSGLHRAQRESLALSYRSSLGSKKFRSSRG